MELITAISSTIIGLLIAAFFVIVLIAKRKYDKQKKEEQEDEIKAYKRNVEMWIQTNGFCISTQFSYHKPYSLQGYYILIDEDHKKLLIVDFFDLHFELIRFKAILGIQILEDKKFAGGVGGIATGTPQVTTTSIFSDFLTKVGKAAVVIYLSDFSQPQIELDFRLSRIQFRSDPEYTAVKKFTDRLMATIRVILEQNEKANKE